MATVTRPGWVVDDPNQSSDVIKATLPAKLLPSPGAGVAGSPSRLLVKSNISNGNYDVYAPGGFLQGDRLIYSVNASNDKPVIRDQSLYNAYFDKNNAQGKSQFDSLNRTIKASTYDNAQLNTGTDPVRNQNFENIKKTAAYQSLANKQKPGSRLAPDDAGDATVPADPNSATTTEQETLPGETEAAKTAKGISGIARNNYGQMTYPIGLDASNQDKIHFQILKYRPRDLALSATNNLSGFAPRSEANAIGHIYLPIPGGISDTNSVDWGDDSMDPFEAVIANTALSSMQGLEQGAKVLKSAAETASTQQGNQSLRGALENQFAAAAIQGEAGRLLSRTTGSVLNPNLELLFKGPQLRSFNFTFKMSARNEPEADMIVKIIHAFKQAMAPQRTETQLFIKAPNTFKIEYLHKGSQGHTRIGQIKECALLSLTTRYAPEGQYATYYDGTPVSYEIDLQFKELEPVFNNDYKEDISIGF